MVAKEKHNNDPMEFDSKTISMGMFSDVTKCMSDQLANTQEIH
jgi:hypothetical protein